MAYAIKHQKSKLSSKVSKSDVNVRNLEIAAPPARPSKSQAAAKSSSNNNDLTLTRKPEHQKPDSDKLKFIEGKQEKREYDEKFVRRTTRRVKDSDDESSSSVAPRTSASESDSAESVCTTSNATSTGDSSPTSSSRNFSSPGNATRDNSPKARAKNNDSGKLTASYVCIEWYASRSGNISRGYFPIVVRKHDTSHRYVCITGRTNIKRLEK